MPPVKDDKAREGQIDELIRLMEIQERIKRDGFLFKIERTLGLPGTRIEEAIPKKKKQEIKEMAEKKSSEEIATEIAKQKKKLKQIALRMKKRGAKSPEFRRKMKEIQALISEEKKEKAVPKAKPEKIEEKAKPEQVEVIQVRITSMPHKRPKYGKKANVLQSIMSIIMAIRGIRRKKPAEKAVFAKGPPQEVKEALEEAQRKRSKIEMMLKEKGKGWYGDKLRHQQAALKVWESVRAKELSELEKKGELSGEERKEKESLGGEMQKIGEAIRAIDEHLNEIEKYKAGEKAGEVSMAVMQEARMAAEKAAEAAKAMPRYAAPEQPTHVLVGKMEGPIEWRSIDEEINYYKNMIKRLEVDYLKRRISEEEYRNRLSEYQQKIEGLEERKKEQEKRKPEIEEEVIEKPMAAKPGIHAAPEQATPEGAAEGRAAPLTPKAISALEKGPPPEITHEKVTEIEKHIDDLLKKYKIPKDEMEKEGRLDSARILHDFDKLIDLVELEREAVKMKEEIPSTRLDILSAITPKRREKIKAMAREITKYRIVTDFDRLLGYVKEKGITNAEKARRDLGIDKGHFKECCDVLEKSGLIRIDYPAIGSMKLMDINYKGEKKGNKDKTRWANE